MEATDLAYVSECTQQVCVSHYELNLSMFLEPHHHQLVHFLFTTVFIYLLACLFWGILSQPSLMIVDTWTMQQCLEAITVLNSANFIFIAHFTTSKLNVLYIKCATTPTQKRRGTHRHKPQTDILQPIDIEELIMRRTKAARHPQAQAQPRGTKVNSSRFGTFVA